MTLLADGLPFGVRKHPGDNNLYEWGVTHEGAFIPLMLTKSGRIEKLVARAKEQQSSDGSGGTTTTG